MGTRFIAAVGRVAPILLKVLAQNLSSPVASFGFHEAQAGVMVAIGAKGGRQSATRVISYEVVEDETAVAIELDRAIQQLSAVVFAAANERNDQ